MLRYKMQAKQDGEHVAMTMVFSCWTTLTMADREHIRATTAGMLRRLGIHANVSFPELDESREGTCQLVNGADCKPVEQTQ